MMVPKTKKKADEANRIIRKMIHLLKNPPDDLPPFILKKKMRGASGKIIWEEIIELGVFYELIPTLIHELLHYMHDEWTETKVLKYEKTIKNYITKNQLISIIKMFAKQL